MPTCTSSGGGESSGLIVERTFSAKDKALIYGLPESERKDYYYSISPNKDTINKINEGSISPNVIADDVKNKYLLINESLPQLEGTPKQISWAEDIRRQKINDQVDRIVKRMRSATKEQKEQVYKQAEVSSFNDFVNKFVTKMDTNGPMMKLKKQRSAKAIIDKYS